MATYTEFVYSDYFKTELPSHWQEKRLGFLAEQTKNAFVDGPFGSDLKSDDYLDEGVPLIQLNNIRDGKHILRNMKFISDHKKLDLIRHLALPKDIVIAKMAEPVARATIVSDEYDEYVIVADCVKLTPNLNLVDLEFLVWAINSDCVRENAELVSTGTTRIRINLGELKKLKVPYPSLTEQIKIREYLDHETAQIDSLITKQEKLIELLKEKRQAVISHAVTKGLNPDVTMKDSGVEWLGQVPEHWVTLPLKLCIKTRKGVAFKAVDFCDFGIRVVKASDIKQKTIRESDVFLPEKYLTEYPKAILKEGELVLSTVGSTPDVKNSAVGQIGKVPKELNNSLLNQNTVVYSAKKNLDQNFLFYVVQADSYRDHLDLHAHGTANQASLNIENMLDFKISIPDLNEQKEITSYLDKKMSEYEKLELHSLSIINLLIERRTALISSAVTGKIDVRNWQHPNEAKTGLSA
ncbi:restriction endonuclease subunit S [Acinetobacter variabilis]|uniref:restriction endonuclease subunit S n=1 Tax=Acinetobacter variabilis TaxID=70346 RepID=UPI00132FB9A5|nr:restriction endonuclease subunit S [Acinetobacter variabilis]